MIFSLFAAGIGGLLLSLAFPPASLDLFAWIAFLPLLWAMDRSVDAGWDCFLSGFLFGLLFFLVDLNWVYHTVTTYGGFGPVGGTALYLSMVATLALFPGAFSAAAGLACRRGWNLALIGPSFWVTTEYLRATVLTRFPWDLVGYSQTSRLTVVQMADVTGVFGISFLVVMINCALWECLRNKTAGEKLPFKLLAISALTLSLVLAYGWFRLSRIPEGKSIQAGFPIGVLQGNIPQKMKWNPAAREYTLETYKKLGQEAVQQGARLLVWPETSVPILFNPKTKAWRIPCAISSALEVPMLVGAPSEDMRPGEAGFYNSAFLVDGDSLRFRYDKIRLVPFGEYMPLSWLLPLGSGMAAREGDYTPGKKMTVMHVEGCPPFSVLICYEAIFPDLSALALAKGARMLVNITNDAWFGRSAAPYQHLAMARMRSIEDRVWFIRSANTGVSCAFDRAGRLIHSLPLDTEGRFVVRVPAPVQAGSFYSRYGDIFAWCCVLATLLVLAGSFRSHGTGPARDNRMSDGKA